MNRLPCPLARAAPAGTAGRLLPITVPLTDRVTRPTALTEPDALLMRTYPFVGESVIRDVLIGPIVTDCGVA